MKIQVRKYKEIKKPCPKCGAVMEYIIQVNCPKEGNNYCIEYDCPNDCELSFKEAFEYITTDEPMVWYEEEEFNV